MSLDRIHIVLVQPSHGGNIGACARAMKNMGLHKLVLVSPDEFPSEQARARAAGADDVLAGARVCQTLDEAIADCHRVIGASARERRIAWPSLAPDEAARMLIADAGNQDVAVLFGRERTGLTNDELDRCQALVTIPSNPEFSSLNLASAVQVIAYEIWRASQGTKKTKSAEQMLGEALATHDEVQQFYKHLELAISDSGFLDPDNPRLLMRRIMRLYNRVQLTRNEVNILRGILTSFKEKTPRANS